MVLGKLAAPVMLYAQPTCADLCERIEVAKMLAAGEAPDACVKRVEQYTESMVREIEACLARARAFESHTLEAMSHYRREAARKTNALIELRQWLLQPVVEHVMLHPQPVYIARSDWERWQEKAK